MLNVLIVDDNKLVRKGLIALMPWQQFGLQVVGEAANGEAALQFLQQNEVDLIFTDLMMPVMSGIELMRAVRMRYPHIWLVVLTFHQDFEYVQEALRIGAIDYIVKTQLEKENLEDVLSRIVGRINADSTIGHDAKRAGSKIGKWGAGNRIGYAFFSIRPGAVLERCGLRLQEDAGDWTEVDNGLWLWMSEGPEEEAERALRRLTDGVDDIAILRLHGIAELDEAEVMKWLREFRDRQFFYRMEPGRSVYEVSVMHERQGSPIVFDEDVRSMRERWLSLYWVNNDEVFHDWLADIERLRLPQATLESIFYSAVREWERTLSVKALPGGDRIGSLPYWHDWVRWLRQMKTDILRMTSKSAYSKEVTDAIFKAADMIRQELNRPFGLVETAESVNMSRSYFSQCFKDIMGKSFNEYIRDQRMAKAVELLEYTNLPINRIAETIGYPNEKYFSRIFRGQMGQSPSEYRQLRRQGAQSSDG